MGFGLVGHTQGGEGEKKEHSICSSDFPGTITGGIPPAMPLTSQCPASGALLGWDSAGKRGDSTELQLPQHPCKPDTPCSSAHHHSSSSMEHRTRGSEISHQAGGVDTELVPQGCAPTNIHFSLLTHGGGGRERDSAPGISPSAGLSKCPCRSTPRPCSVLALLPQGHGKAATDAPARADSQAWTHTGARQTPTCGTLHLTHTEIPTNTDISPKLSSRQPDPQLLRLLQSHEHPQTSLTSNSPPRPERTTTLIPKTETQKQPQAQIQSCKKLLLSTLLQAGLTHCSDTEPKMGLRSTKRR